MADDAVEPVDDLIDEDFETLPCNCTYVVVCIVMSFLNGQLMTLLYPGYTLYFAEMGWPLVNAGTAMTIGYAIRVVIQQVMLRTGYWFAVPVAVVHLVFATLAVFNSTSEWAIFAEIVVFVSMDTTCAIEGIAFDSFGSSEVQARQASSTSLSVYTIAVSLSVAGGAVAFDLFSWPGVAAYHAICQGLVLLSLCIFPACRRSFMAYFFPAKDDFGLEDEQVEAQDEAVFLKVVPETPGAEAAAEADVPLPGATEDMALQEVEDETLEKAPGQPNRGSVGSHVDNARSSQRSNIRSSNMARASQQFRMSQQSRTRNSQATQGSRNTQMSAHSAQSGGSLRSASKRVNDAAPGLQARAARPTLHLRSSVHTAATRISGIPHSTKDTAASRNTLGTALSRLTSLSDAGHEFQHMCIVNNALNAQVVGETGHDSVLRDLMPDVDEKMEEKESKAGIPKDVRLPAFLIFLNAALNNFFYISEYVTFAIYFRQVHNWDQATWAGLTQMAGDIMAAIAVQVVPALFEGSYDPQKAGCVRRWCHYLTSKPYNLSFLLFTWILFNFGMMSPWLPLAIAAQVLMGCSYVYSAKWTTEMNLYYSLGDPKVFLSLQTACRNGEAVGGGVAGVLSMWLYNLEPVAPFALTGGVACLIFLAYTAGFCARLGLKDDIETAEEMRAARKGITRAILWKK